ncbi:hypothetical protein BLA29_000866 [Euroglyphus maynei]|uniref:Uncharacterized protein n=1 Tax=Euroglyphus maynei TaxID=6958 RepID=A0A1Y3BMW3_EURMA|nr:hypothetical protein BLA29_000866 [Euroglyphus maynei]
MEQQLHSCKTEFETMFNYTKNILDNYDHRDDLIVQCQQSVCYAICQYDDCVLKSIERFSQYSLDLCDETDVLSSESILYGLEMKQDSPDNIVKWWNDICSEITCSHLGKYPSDEALNKIIIIIITREKIIS